MNLAIQRIANDKTVRSVTVQDIKDFNNQSLATQAQKGEQLVSMMPAIKKTFNLLGDDIQCARRLVYRRQQTSDEVMDKLDLKYISTKKI